MRSNARPNIADRKRCIAGAKYPLASRTPEFSRETGYPPPAVVINQDIGIEIKVLMELRLVDADF
jgi:hypothetical protein